VACYAMHAFSLRYWTGLLVVGLERPLRAPRPSAVMIDAMLHILAKDDPGEKPTKKAKAR
jgi:hypothetical protein